MVVKKTKQTHLYAFTSIKGVDTFIPFASNVRSIGEGGEFNDKSLIER